MLSRLLPLLLLIALVLGCAKPPTQAEATVTEQTDFGVTMEARQYFADPTCSVWTEDISSDQLQQIVSELYAAGSPNVFFAGIEELEGRKISALLFYELPADKAARSKVFAIHNRIWTAIGEDPDEDTGQKLLSLSLD